MSMLADSHDIHCDCNSPFSHLLVNLFPPGHKDRDLTINQIIKRDFQLCLSGGNAAAAGTSHSGKGKGKDGPPEEEEEDHYIKDEEIAGVADPERDEGDTR